MSFNSYAKKVRNIDLPMAHRAAALRSCALRIAQQLKKKRSEVLELIYKAVCIRDPKNLQEEELIKAITFLEKYRERELL